MVHPLSVFCCYHEAKDAKEQESMKSRDCPHPGRAVRGNIVVCDGGIRVQCPVAGIDICNMGFISCQEGPDGEESIVSAVGVHVLFLHFSSDVYRSGR